LFVIIFFIATSVSDVRVMTSTFRLKCELNPYGKDAQTHQNQKNSLISNFLHSEVNKALHFYHCQFKFGKFFKLLPE